MQLVVAEKSKRIICTAHDQGKTHDFKVLKKSKLPLRKGVKVKGDSGCQGIEEIHANSQLPEKGSKHHPLTRKQKAANRKLSKKRVLVEHVIGSIKVFRMMAERYRNKRQKHAMRMKLICGIYNYEYASS